MSLNIKQKLRELRKKHKLTQEQLADLSGVDYKHIQLLESKNPPSVRIDTIEKLAKAFDLKCSKLMDFGLLVLLSLPCLALVC